MIKRKICMLGAFAVGKTSLVQRFAHGLFSERYHTTVGVRIEKKTLELDTGPMTLLIWDLHGEDEFQEVRTSYLRGAAGCLYVVDGTRRETLDTMLKLHERISEHYEGLPAVVLLNKSDQQDLWELNAADRRRAATVGLPMLTVSAKTADGVDDAFELLARQLEHGP